MSKTNKMQMILDLNTQLQMSYPPNKSSQLQMSYPPYSKNMKECWTPETMEIPSAQLPTIPSAPADSWLSPNLLRPFYSIQDNMREFWYPTKENDEATPPPPPPPYTKLSDPQPCKKKKKAFTIGVLVFLFLLVVILAMVVVIYVRYGKKEEKTNEGNTSFIMTENMAEMFGQGNISLLTNKKFLQMFWVLKEENKNLTHQVWDLKGQVVAKQADGLRQEMMLYECVKREDKLKMSTTTQGPCKITNAETAPYKTSYPPLNDERSTKNTKSPDVFYTTERALTKTTTSNSIRIAHNNGVFTTNEPPITRGKPGEASNPNINKEGIGINGNGLTSTTTVQSTTTISALDGTISKGTPYEPKDYNDQSQNASGNQNQRNENTKTGDNLENSKNKRNPESVTGKFQSYDKFQTPVPIATTPRYSESTFPTPLFESTNEDFTIGGEKVVTPSGPPKIHDQTRNNYGNNSNAYSDTEKDSKSTENGTKLSSGDNNQKSNQKETEKPNGKGGALNSTTGGGIKQTNESVNHNSTIRNPNGQQDLAENNGNRNNSRTTVSPTEKPTKNERKGKSENYEGKTKEKQVDDSLNSNTRKRNVTGYDANMANENKPEYKQNTSNSNSTSHKSIPGAPLNNSSSNEKNKFDDLAGGKEMGTKKDSVDKNKSTSNGENGIDKLGKRNGLNEENNSKGESKSNGDFGDGKPKTSKDIIIDDQKGKPKSPGNESNAEGMEKDKAPPQYDDGKSVNNENLEKNTERPFKSDKNDHKHRKGKSKGDSLDENNSKEIDSDEAKSGKETKNSHKTKEDDSDESKEEKKPSKGKDKNKKKDSNYKQSDNSNSKIPGNNEKESKKYHEPKNKDVNGNANNKKENTELNNTFSNDDEENTKVKEHTAHWKHYYSKDPSSSNVTDIAVICNFTKTFNFPFSHLNNSCYQNFKNCNSDHHQIAKKHQVAKTKNTTFQYNTTCLLLLIDTGKDPATAIMSDWKNYILSIAGSHHGSFSILICSGSNILIQIEIYEIGDQGDLARIILTSKIEKSKGDTIVNEEVHPVRMKHRGEFKIVVVSGKDDYKIYFNNFNKPPLTYKHFLKENNAVRVIFKGPVRVSALTFEIII